MKYSLVFTLLLGMSFNLYSNVPVMVSNQFSNQYPETNDPVWEKHMNRYVALFQDQQGLKKAYFDLEGKWIETRVFLTGPDLPESILQFLSEKDYLMLVHMVNLVYNEHDTWYRVEFESQQGTRLRFFDKDGHLVLTERKS